MLKIGFIAGILCLAHCTPRAYNADVQSTSATAKIVITNTKVRSPAFILATVGNEAACAGGNGGVRLQVPPDQSWPLTFDVPADTTRIWICGQASAGGQDSALIPVQLTPQQTLTIKDDAVVGASSYILTCNSNDLTLAKATDGTYSLEINNAGVVDFFKRESLKEEQPNVTGYPWTGKLQKTLPDSTTIKETPAKKLTIVGLKSNDGRSYGVGQYLPSADFDGKGLRVIISNAEMVGSHSMATWVVGEWYFENCTQASR